MGGGGQHQKRIGYGFCIYFKERLARGGVNIKGLKERLAKGLKERLAKGRSKHQEFEGETRKG